MRVLAHSNKSNLMSYFEDMVSVLCYWIGDWGTGGKKVAEEYTFHRKHEPNLFFNLKKMYFCVFIATHKYIPDDNECSLCMDTRDDMQTIVFNVLTFFSQCEYAIFN